MTATSTSAPSPSPAAATAPAAAAPASKTSSKTDAKPAKKAASKSAAASKKLAPAATAPSAGAGKPTAASASAASKDGKAKKPKLVRDSFTIPKDEYAAIETLKQRCAALAHPVKKSELLRAGLKVLAGMPDAALRKAIQAVPSIKTGRPTKADHEAEAAPSPAPKKASSRR